MPKYMGLLFGKFMFLISINNTLKMKYKFDIVNFICNLSEFCNFFVIDLYNLSKCFTIIILKVMDSIFGKKAFVKPPAIASSEGPLKPINMAESPSLPLVVAESPSLPSVVAESLSLPSSK